MTTSDKLPVTLLSGFLGAGKTTLLKHILHTQHSQAELFRCAVIVNDMAELNIDQALVEQTAVLQSDEVVALQNGCVCCSLQDDLIAQITELAASNQFDYMIIEGSGVSEPEQISQIFASCGDDHDHSGEDHHEPTLGQVARLDTCVTVVDSTRMLDADQQLVGDSSESLPQLMAEQIEYANVILLNKTDLVDADQLEVVRERVALLNPRARIVAVRHSQVAVEQVVDTRLYEPSAFGAEAQVQAFVEPAEKKTIPLSMLRSSCCATTQAKGLEPCCAPVLEEPRAIRTARSEVVLPEASRDTRHASRFGITSFLYRSRRPFHPEHFYTKFMQKFFVQPEGWDDEEESTQEEVSPAEALKQLQEQALGRRRERAAALGEVLRAKGFLWLAHAHDLRMSLNQAGDVATLVNEGFWTALNPLAYSGGEKLRAKLRRDWDGPWKDRRQELVFIGQNLNHEAIQAVLDECLMSDEELEGGVDYWKATIGDVVLGLG